MKASKAAALQAKAASEQAENLAEVAGRLKRVEAKLDELLALAQEGAQAAHGRPDEAAAEEPVKAESAGKGK